MRLPSPQRLGLPSHFVKWRLPQERAIVDLIDSEVRFSGINAPTGSGKSLLAVGLAQLLPPEDRVLILTSTKALQDQYVRAFAEIGLRDIRGKSNYRCHALAPGGEHEGHGSGTAAASDPGSFISVEHAPCFTLNLPCSLRSGGCEWFDALSSARRARIVVANYAKWISTPNFEEDLGRFNWIILDEAADADQHLTDALHVDIKRADVERYLRVGWPAAGSPGAGNTRIVDWVEWARHVRATADAALRAAEAQVAEARSRGTRISPDVIGRYSAIRDLVAAITTLRTLRGDWVVDDLKVFDRVIGVMFDPVWPAPYAESMLYRDAERVVLMGATFVEKHLDILGAPRGERTFTTYPSTFAVARRPVIYVKLDPADALKMSYAAEQSESFRHRVVAVGDRIIADRGDRNGLVHSVSYKRARYIRDLSEHRETMITHAANSEATRAAVERYKGLADTPPWQLVSPAVGTGVDFPMQTAEYAWIPKLPFRDRNSALMRARTEIDPKYPDFVCACDLVQMCGRIVRSAADSGECLITDAQFAWFPWRRDKHGDNRELFPAHFLDAIRRSDGFPRPLAKLTSRSS